MSKSASRIVLVVLLALGVVMVWVGGGWAWHQLLLMHGRH